MEEAAVDVAEPVLDKTVGCIFASIGRQISYVRRYSENIENLRRRLTELRIVREKVEYKIERATNNGDIVRENVSVWLKKAEEMEKDTNAFLPGEVKSNNIRCLKCLFAFPNIKSRYRLGKEAVKRTEVVAEHDKLGEKFEDAVISDPAPPPDLTYRHGSSDYQGFESRRSIFEEIMTALKDETIQRIGIWGMGGVGKTTMVAEVGDKAKKDHIFDEVVMAVVSHDPKVTDIQEKLAAQLKMDRVDNEAEFNITSRLYNRLKKGNNLVILDDVWKKINLNDIGIPSPNEARDCKVLFTSREMGALKVQKLIHVNVLCKEEAWKLFEKEVGDALDSHDAMLDLAKDVCGECGGLPVAILAIAGTLKEDESEDKWEDVLLNLKHSKLKNIGGEYEDARVCLELSYNYLKSEEEKSCFLFCCLFPEDYDIPVDSLMRLGRGMRVPDDMTAKLRSIRCTIRDLVRSLKKRSLLLEGKDSEHVKMHDVVRDVAISIALERRGFLIGENLQQWTETKPYDFCSVISLTSHEDFHELSVVSEYPKLHTILLKCKFKNEPSSSPINFDSRESSCSPISISDRFFNNMTKLHVLAIQDMKISPLPSSMKILHDLRILSLINCDLDGVSFVGEFRKLEMLILQGSTVHVLPTQVGDLTCLKLLDMRNCENLEIISPTVLSRLSKLEELFMPWDFEKWGYGAINDTKKSAYLTELEALNQLESLQIHVPKFEMMPQHSRFPFWGQLKMFKISVQTFLDEEEHEESKNVMKLEGVPLTRGLDLLLKRVEALDITRLKGLRDFKLQNGDRESFSRLEDLRANSCEGMQEFLATVLERPVLPRPPSWKLGVLMIRSCNLRKLLSPSAAEALVLLRRLGIEGCKNMEAVVGRNDVAPGRSGQATERVIFRKLECLVLGDLPNLVSFYPKMNQTTGLEESQEFSAQPLFNDKVAFPELKKLAIYNAGECKEVVGLHLPAQESFSKLRELRVVCMNNCSRIGSSTLIPRLQSLERLYLCDCRSLRAVFKAERSEISEREEIVAIDGEKSIPVEVSVLPALQSLSIIMCSLLKEICWDSCLGSKEATDTERPFFSHRVAFPELEFLSIKKAGECEEIVGLHLPAQGSFSKLRELIVGGMSGLSAIGSSTLIPRLQSLRKITIGTCGSLRAVFKAERRQISEREETVAMVHQKAATEECFEFPALEVLDIHGCRLLEEFWSNQCSQSIEEREKIRFFHNRIGFPKLSRLRLQGMEKVEEIWMEDRIPPPHPHSFCNLTRLTIDRFPKLKSAISPVILPRLYHLKTLGVWECESVREVIKVVGVRSEEVVGEESSPSTALAFPAPCNLRQLTIERSEKMEEIVSCWGSMGKEVAPATSAAASSSSIAAVSNQIIFPHLESLSLRDLPSLKTLCPPGYSLFHPESSLKWKNIEGCPNLPRNRKTAVSVQSDDLCHDLLFQESFR